MTWIRFDKNRFSDCVAVEVIMTPIWFECSCFLSHNCCCEWEGGPIKQINHTSWIDVVTPIYRPKSVRNRCVFELFDCVFVLPL